jgi:hypothetical protein
MMRLLKSGDSYQPDLSQIEYVPLQGIFPESLTLEMDNLLFALQNGEIKTGVSFERP